MDIYDTQIEKLTKNPAALVGQWITGQGLFKFIGASHHVSAGCLTMIKKGGFYATVKGKVDHELTEEIQKDARIPDCCDNITIESLQVLAEWHRRIDKLQNL